MNTTIIDLILLLKLIKVRSLVLYILLSNFLIEHPQVGCYRFPLCLLIFKQCRVGDSPLAFEMLSVGHPDPPRSTHRGLLHLNCVLPPHTAIANWVSIIKYDIGKRISGRVWVAAWQLKLSVDALCICCVVQGSPASKPASQSVNQSSCRRSQATNIICISCQGGRVMSGQSSQPNRRTDALLHKRLTGDARNFQLMHPHSWTPHLNP